MDTVEYFAIGSMMNPVSLKIREIYPIKSRPGLLEGYELIFVMANGYAAARKCNTNDQITVTKEIHGVLHTITKESMEKLDKIESTYVKAEEAQIKLYEEEKLYNKVNNLLTEANTNFSYNENCVIGKVYILNKDIVSLNPKKFDINPPSERYIDIIKEGARYFGIKVRLIYAI